jgi:hypothetical protein
MTTPVQAIPAKYPSNPSPIQLYSHFREPKIVTCTEDGAFATVQVDAKMAAVTTAFGVPGLRIISCSRWPRACGRGCIAQLASIRNQHDSWPSEVSNTLEAREP